MEGEGLFVTADDFLHGLHGGRHTVQALLGLVPDAARGGRPALGIFMHVGLGGTDLLNGGCGLGGRHRQSPDIVGRLAGRAGHLLDRTGCFQHKGGVLIDVLGNGIGGGAHLGRDRGALFGAPGKFIDLGNHGGKGILHALHGHHRIPHLGHLAIVTGDHVVDDQLELLFSGNDLIQQMLALFAPALDGCDDDLLKGGDDTHVIRLGIDGRHILLELEAGHDAGLAGTNFGHGCGKIAGREQRTDNGRGDDHANRQPAPSRSKQQSPRQEGNKQRHQHHPGPAGGYAGIVPI